jgi:hypothetical protein
VTSDILETLDVKTEASWEMPASTMNLSETTASDDKAMYQTLPEETPQVEEPAVPIDMVIDNAMDINLVFDETPIGCC